MAPTSSLEWAVPATALRSRLRLLPTQLIFSVWTLWFAGLCLIHPEGAPFWPWIPLNLLLLGVLLPLGGRLRASAYLPPRGGVLGYFFLQLFLVLPLVYEEAGAFRQRLVPALPVEHWLSGLDRGLFGLNWRHRLPPALGLANDFWQAVYLLNYLLLFLGLLLAIRPCLRRPSAAETAPGERPPCLHRAEAMVGAMLSALMLSYCFFPLLPGITPRLYYPQLHQPADGWLHNLNWWLLGRFSIPYGIFPSAHVAGPIALGCALSARREMWGGLFLLGGGLIAVATVMGDYHFIVDALGGVLVGIAAWALVEWQLRLPQIAAPDAGMRWQ